jgi:acyl-coenzyme A synthetase/AMP-(fatty) acid ligase
VIERIGDIPCFWSEWTPDAAALWEEGATYSFAQLTTLVEEGIRLLTSHGVRRGDRVLIVLKQELRALL